MPSVSNMTSQQNIFVFIDEDQQKKYSKSTLSAINAQVAKYAHKNRPFTSKCRPARRPCSNGLTQDEEPAKLTKHYKPGGRKASNIASTDSQARTQASSLTDDSQSVKDRSRTSTPRQEHATRRTIACKRKAANTAFAHAKPEDFNRLFSRLCRITKLPTYQEFPFFLNIEERQLTHYCKPLLFIKLWS